MYYEYRYVDENNEEHVVERQYRIGQAPQTITVTDGDAVYLAELMISGGAGPMKTNWGIGAHSDLPPENYKGEL